MKKTATQNKKTPTMATIFTETRTLSEWSRQENVPLNIICARYARGKRGVDLLKPYQTKKTNTARQRKDPSIPLTEELITKNGKTMSLKEWSMATGIRLTTIMQRYSQNKTPEQVLNTNVPLATHINPPKNNPSTQLLVTYNNETRNLTQWSKHLNIPYTTILNRYKRHIEGNITLEEILIGSYRRNTTTNVDSYSAPHININALQSSLMSSMLLPPKPKPQPTAPKPQPISAEILDPRQQLKALLANNKPKPKGLPTPVELTPQQKIKAGTLTTWLYRDKEDNIGAPLPKRHSLRI